METNWIILSVILVAAIGLVVYLIVRNQKDKDEVIESLNDEASAEEETADNKEEI